MKVNILCMSNFSYVKKLLCLTKTASSDEEICIKYLV